MEKEVFERHARLRACRPVQFMYIMYRRVLEQGVSATWLWALDKIQQRVWGFSQPQVSRVQPRLYVGGQQRHWGLARMRQVGIDAVVNMRAESDDAQRGVALTHYLHLATTDDDPPTYAALRQGVDFIAEHITAERGVYIHCAAGVGRAPTMAAAYLVSTGQSPAQAWDTIRQVRPFVRPTPAQFAVVEAFAVQFAGDLPSGRLRGS